SRRAGSRCHDAVPYAGGGRPSEARGRRCARRQGSLHLRIDRRAGAAFPRLASALLLQAAGEYRHFLFRLLVAFALCRFDAAPVSLERFIAVAGVGERLAERLPCRRVQRILRHRVAQIADRAPVLAGLRVLHAQREAQQRAVAAGSSLDQAVRMTVYLTDLAHFARVNEIMAQYVREPFPARAAVGVSGLPRGALVEIDAILHSG